MICSNAGTKDSPPSNPNLLVPINFFAKNFSNPSAFIIVLRIAFFPLFVKLI